MSKKRVLEIRTFISRKGIVQVADIMKKFNYRKPTVLTYLGKTGALSSCNFKGQYYILPDLYQFDENGLLFIDGVGFYEGGSLLRAICNLVDRSSSGLGARELDQLLNTTTHSQLPVLFRKGLLTREKAVNRAGNAFYYFSADPQKAEVQRLAYFNPTVETVEEVDVELTSDELPDVIDILVTLITHPDFSIKSVERSLRSRGLKISKELVARVFEKYLIGKKKY